MHANLNTNYGSTPQVVLLSVCMSGVCCKTEAPAYHARLQACDEY